MITPTEALHRAGQGNWGAFLASGYKVSTVEEAARGWADQLAGVDRPWLCWNVDDDWCFVQQQLVKSVGWTPIVGFDPRVGPPAKNVSGAVVVDFNAGINLPVMYPHFPLEFAFLFTDRIAFWHSDLLLRLPIMQSMAERFASLKDGQTAATRSNPGLRYTFTLDKQRYWELIGCTTRAASRRQFENGCGWWMEFYNHPNTPPSEKAERQRYFWDHGTGVYFWQKRKNGDVIAIRDKAIHEGHFTKIGNKNYKSSFTRMESDAQRLMKQELRDNFDLMEACRKMGLTSLVSA